MSVDINLLLAIAGGIISVVTFFAGKMTSAKSSGHEWGELKADVKHIKDDVAEVKAQNRIISEQYSTMRTDVEVVKRDLKTAFSKIDDIKAR